MSSAQVGAVLRHIRHLATARKDQELPDRQLLERFAAHRDEAAFAALLGRHGPMVLGVCRSVLHDLHDAEDAFQAAFLLLAQKAESIHRREAVSGWLYRVAYHLAVRAKANAARRRVLEKRAVTMPSADPVFDMSLREVRAVLFDELEELPEQYRAPLVLCVMEEKSLNEAARVLGWTKWAVKGRLQRGRELLRGRLRRRGLELPAALSTAALALNSASAQVSPTLADSTLRAAVQLAGGGGVVSSEVAALVQGASKTMFHSKIPILTTVFVAMTLAATTFGLLRLQASAAMPQQIQPEPKAKGDRPPTDAPAKPEREATIEVRGRVLDPDGKPLAGAKLYLAKHSSKTATHALQATSGPDGRFHFAVAASEMDNGSAEKSTLKVMAVAAGHGCDWVALDLVDKELTLRLVKDVPINGRILDPEGKPVAGAKLTVRWVVVPKGDDLEIYIKESRKGYGPASTKDWNGPLPGGPAALTTGPDGRFRLAGVGRERVVRFWVEGPGIASMYLHDVMTRASETLPGTAEKWPIYGASFDHVALASRPIRGAVRDAESGKPLAGVLVSDPYDVCQTHTDKDGHYELLGLAKAPAYSLEARPADGLHFEIHVKLRDIAGLGALTSDIELVQSLMVHGRVTDKTTGKPVAQARVEYHPLGGNTNVIGKVAGKPRSKATTSADGSYTLTVLPGPGVVGITGPKPETYMPAFTTLKERKAFFKSPILDHQGDDVLTTRAGVNSFSGIFQQHFNALVLLEPGKQDKALVRDVVLEPPLERKGRVVGPDGKPLTGVTVIGLLPYWPQCLNVNTLKGNEFVVRGINPRASRSLLFRHQAKNLGLFIQELRGDSSEPVTIKLQPCGSISGRVLDEDGQPLTGLALEVRGMGLRMLIDGQTATTDKKGRFRAEGLVAAQEYRVLDLNPSSAHSRIFVKAVPESGKNKDLGDIKMAQQEK
jgi:RNA polymerase sigma factor (sigma-70 family)